MKQLTFSGFLIRLSLALVLVFLTFNPSQYNFISWIMDGEFEPLKGLGGIALLIGWVIFIRASLRSLGPIGLGLASVFFGFLIWLFIDLGWLNLEQTNAFTWVILAILAFILSIGMSWSHIRRRMSGQLDTDDVDN